jgi:predicted CopG family antitoxin
MVVKTITIDINAYSLLDAEKNPGETFSKVIKRKLSEAPAASDLLRHLDRIRMSDETLDRLEEVVRHRADSPVAPVSFTENNRAD